MPIAVPGVVPILTFNRVYKGFSYPDYEILCSISFMNCSTMVIIYKSSIRTFTGEAHCELKTFRETKNFSINTSNYLRDTMELANIKSQ